MLYHRIARCSINPYWQDYRKDKCFYDSLDENGHQMDKYCAIC